MHLESQICVRVPLKHLMVPWMVEWSGNVLYKYILGADGKTGYERVTGHKVRHKVAGFGELVLFKLATDESSRNKYDGEWQAGYFAGVINRSSEYIFIVQNRIFKAPTLRRRPSDSAYSSKVILSLIHI